MGYAPYKRVTGGCNIKADEIMAENFSAFLHTVVILSSFALSIFSGVFVQRFSTFQSLAEIRNYEEFLY